jgi:hypothetical protein
MKKEGKVYYQTDMWMVHKSSHFFDQTDIYFKDPSKINSAQSNQLSKESGDGTDGKFKYLLNISRTRFLFPNLGDLAVKLIIYGGEDKLFKLTDIFDDDAWYEYR